MVGCTAISRHRYRRPLLSQHQHATPLIVRGDRTTALSRVPLGETSYNEDWLQRLLFEHPQLLPVAEIEPWFDGLLPVARELPTAAGPLDLLFINPRGYLTLVETKLWRNPTARREVVGQLIDYTKEIARWSYGELLDAIRVARALTQRSGDATDPLVDLARAASPDFDERDFVDNVQRGLRRGQFLILIVGDGIRQEVVQIADFLQSTPTLGFTLGLVELALFRTGEPGDETLFVQPRTLARTEVLTRAVVEVRAPSRVEDIRVTLSVEDESEAKVAKVRRKITEVEFLDHLAANCSAEVVEFVRWALAQTDDVAAGISLKWGEGGPLFKFYDPELGANITFCGFSRDGKLTTTEYFTEQCQRVGAPDEVAQQYLAALAALFRNGVVKKSDRTTGAWQAWIATKDQYYPELADLAPKAEEWLTLLQQTVEALRVAMERR